MLSLSDLMLRTFRLAMLSAMVAVEKIVRSVSTARRATITSAKVMLNKLIQLVNTGEASAHTSSNQHNGFSRFQRSFLKTELHPSCALVSHAMLLSPDLLSQATALQFLAWEALVIWV